MLSLELCATMLFKNRDVHVYNHRKNVYNPASHPRKVIRIRTEFNSLGHTLHIYVGYATLFSYVMVEIKTNRYSPC